MLDRDQLSTRLAALAGYLEEIRSFRRHTREELAATPSVHSLAERYVHLACECVLDTAHHVIAEMGCRQPQSHRDAIRSGTTSPTSMASRAAWPSCWAGLDAGCPGSPWRMPGQATSESTHRGQES